MKQPASGIAHSIEDARRIAKEIGYPVLVRPSFVLGGRGMAIVYRESELDSYVSEAVAASEGKPILIDKFLSRKRTLLIRSMPCRANCASRVSTSRS